MIVDELLRKCVLFVGIQLHDESFRMVGTAFFLGKNIQGSDHNFGYLVTAKHVLDGIRNLGLDRVYTRVNLKDGTAAWVGSNLSAWWYHPTDSTVDVAMLRASPLEEHDHVHYSLGSTASLKSMSQNSLGIGSEVFIIGMFAPHHGANRNIPIARMGNIAALPEEPIMTEIGPTEVFLIEARSTSGLSGSPVFTRLSENQILAKRLSENDDGLNFYLLGLMHGHWDEKERRPAENAINPSHRINTGIGMVVPAEKILEVINQTAILDLEIKEIPEILKRFN